MFCYLKNPLVIKPNENLLGLNLVSTEDVEEPPITKDLLFFQVCWAALVENEVDYIFDDNI